jgi:uncharacterized protein YycO
LSVLTFAVLLAVGLGAGPGPRGALRLASSDLLNLAPNPSFEEGSGNTPRGWTYGQTMGIEGTSGAWDTTVARSGDRSLSLTTIVRRSPLGTCYPDAIAWWSTADPIPVDTSKTYRFSAWARWSAAPPSSFLFSPSIHLDEDAADYGNGMWLSAPPDTWRELSLTIGPGGENPWHERTSRVELALWGVASPELCLPEAQVSIWYDDVALTVIDGEPAAPTPTPTAGPATPTPCPTTCSQAPNGLNTCDLQAGDILLSQQVGGLYAAENLLFDGYWTHAGIYNGCGMITESSGHCDSWWQLWTCSDKPGVEVKPIEDSGFWSAPDWAILRTKSDGGKRDAAVTYAKAQEGKKYNWIYPDKWTTDKFYCSQLVWRAYQKQGTDLDSNRGAINALTKWVGPWGVADAAGVMAAVPPDDIYFDDDVTLVKQRPGIGAALRRAVLRILSPADLYVTDPEGRHTGVDPNTGQVVEEIPGIFYSGPDVEPEFLSIQDMAGTWRIQVVGTAEGAYTLQAESIDADNHQVAEATGGTAQGVVATYDATYADTPGGSISLAPTSLPQQLAAGWNQPCYLGPAQPIEDALADILPDVLAVYRLSGSQSFESWFPGRPDVSTITAIRPYEPLFILMAKDAAWSQTPSGTPPSSVNLAQGWNSVCYAGMAKAPEDATSGIADELAILYTLGSDQAWGHYVPGRPEASNISQLNQHDAVLMLVTEAGGTQWVFDP